MGKTNQEDELRDTMLAYSAEASDVIIRAFNEGFLMGIRHTKGEERGEDVGKR